MLPASKPPTTATVTFTSRPLPAGDCGFVSFVANHPIPKCQCRSFWPSPQMPVLCACGHHACFHAQERTPPAQQMLPPPPAYSPAATTGPVPACYLPRLSRLEQIVDVQTAQLQMLDEKVVGLTDRAEEAEERLTGMEMFGVELEDQIDTLLKRHDAVEHALELARERAPAIFAPPEPAAKVLVKREDAEQANEGSETAVDRREEQTANEEKGGKKEDAGPPAADTSKSTATKRRLCNAESERPSSSPDSKKRRQSTE